MFLNDSDLDTVAYRLGGSEARPNLKRAVDTLLRLAYWANANSDGWHSWPKPSRASQKLQQIAHDYVLYVNPRDEKSGDITAAQLTAALAPVKAFLTRQGLPADVKRHILGEAA